MACVIYKITNIINSKIYIGKTKEFYKNKYFGINARFKNHISSAFSKKKSNDCPRLYNAIRKYGKENFKIDLIEKSNEENIDKLECYYIDFYKSFDRKIGYNIALGGGGRTVVDVTEETRNKISNSQTKNGILNIKPYFNKKKEHVGYFAKRRENGTVFQKYFTSTKFSVDENLLKAKDWVENLKKNKTDLTSKYNRNNDLPKNINYIKDKKNSKLIIGYRVDILKNNIKIRKSFQSKKKNLNELLQMAINFKSEVFRSS
jgi:group I intron endonuclease